MFENNKADRSSEAWARNYSFVKLTLSLGWHATTIVTAIAPAASFVSLAHALVADSPLLLAALLFVSYTFRFS